MIKIIGGTYREINLDLGSHEIFGSGLRAANFLLENSKQQIEYYSYGNKEIEEFLTLYKNTYKKFGFTLSKSDDLISFKYDFSLDSPLIIPELSSIIKKSVIKIEGGNFICFGMLEGDFEINAERAVYDPQTAINPTKFSKNNKAKELIYIVNHSEALSISNSCDIKECVNFFFDVEKVKALIIKNGPSGAILYIDKETMLVIPSYVTPNVSKIGSGDIFTSAFGFFWLENSSLSIQECAKYASMCAAHFCNDKTMKIEAMNFENFEFQEYKPLKSNKTQIYIASPIFSLADVILVDKIRSTMLNLEVKVISPYHDIGYGIDTTIAEADLKAIDESDLIFAILDGLDSGTLIELGYAMSNGKKIIGYNRTIKQNSLLMLSTANISYYSDLTTAIYHSIWNL